MVKYQLVNTITGYIVSIYNKKRKARARAKKLNLKYGNHKFRTEKTFR